mmetsp:Transcript_11717/g.25366  ORF Transcript_11717/g.25366 Transcript_11717/m.25366 type:complete len:211 (-) Transcript_11717:328-960(-)
MRELQLCCSCCCCCCCCWCSCWRCCCWGCRGRRLRLQQLRFCWICRGFKRRCLTFRNRIRWLSLRSFGFKLLLQLIEIVSQVVDLFADVGQFHSVAVDLPKLTLQVLFDVVNLAKCCLHLADLTLDLLDLQGSNLVVNSFQTIGQVLFNLRFQFFQLVVIGFETDRIFLSNLIQLPRKIVGSSLESLVLQLHILQDTGMFLASLVHFRGP